MAAGDVAQLVGDDRLQLVGIVGRGDQAGVEIDHLPGGNEGIDLGIVDQNDLDAARVELGRFDQRTRHVAEQLLGLAVAQHRLRRHRLGGGERQRQRKHEEPDGPADGEHHALAVPPGG